MFDGVWLSCVTFFYPTVAALYLSSDDADSDGMNNKTPSICEIVTHLVDVYVYNHPGCIRTHVQKFVCQNYRVDSWNKQLVIQRDKMITRALKRHINVGRLTKHCWFYSFTLPIPKRSPFTQDR